MVCPTSRNIRANQRCVSIFIYELRLSRTATIRTRALHFQFDNAFSSYAVRARGIRCATLDSNRTDKPSAVGVFKADNDNLHGGDFGRAHGAIKHDSRFDTNRGLYRLAVPASFEATGLRHVASIYGDIFRNGDSVRNALADFLGVAAFPVLWHFMKDYQKMRIMVFLDPNVDPLGSGYHIIQSKIAIGSGMLFGKGLFEGTQSQLNFLPENHTDFIFAVVGEELGFVGAVVLLLLYLIVLWRGIMIAKDAADVFGRLLAVGITSMLAFHVLVNVGMTTGIMPVTGIPLPLMSYGISSLTTNILAIAILLNINMHRQKFLW